MTQNNSTAFRHLGSRIQAFRSVALLLLTVGFIEFLIMLLINPIEISDTAKAIIDSILLVTFLSPVIYYQIVIPMERARHRTLMLSESQFHAIILNTTSAIIGMDSEGNVSIWNQAASRMFGYSANEAIGKSMHALIAPERCLHASSEPLKHFFVTGKGPLVGNTSETEALHKNGTEFPVELSISSYEWEGKWHAVGIVRDVTKRKQTELLVLQEKEKAQRYLDIVGVMVMALDRQGNITLLNQRACQVLGWDEQEAMGKNWFKNFIPQDELEEVKGVFDQLLKEGVNVVEFYQNRIRCKGGEERIITWHNSTLKGEDGNVVGLLSSGEDITEHKQAEDALAKSEERFSFAMKGANDGLWDWNLQTNDVVYSTRWKSMLGYAEDELENGLETWEKLVHPDDIERAKQVIDDYLSAKTPNYELEFKMHHKDGHWVDILARGFAVRSEPSGEPVRFIGTHVDISEQKRSKEMIRMGLIGTITAISKVVEVRDPYTAGHQQRVSQLSRAIAQEMKLDEDRIEGIRIGASIHDIGKIQIPSEILSKPGKLTATEYMLIQSHSEAGYDILKDIEFPWPVADIAYQHHERIDGSGYPRGIKGDEICLEAKIVAVADVVEAISSHRPYRASLGLDIAMEEIKTHRGSKYDETVVDVCLKLFDENRFSF